MEYHLPAAIRKLSDEEWLQMLIESTKSSKVNGIEFPSFPANDTQIQFVGSANERTLQEAFVFYKFFKNQAIKAGNPIRRESRFLDFGCGWGRYLRFFWKDVEPENLFGCDTSSLILDVCRATNVPGKIDQINPLGVLPYPDASFDAIMSYSVFTHLPEAVHLHWMKELARVAKPGCTFTLTLEPRRFLDFIGGIPEDTEMEWYQLLSAHKPRLADFYQNFDKGNFVFMPTNVGAEERYGDAVVPLSYIERNWQPFFEVLNYVDEPSQFWQAVLTVRRTGVEFPSP